VLVELAITPRGQLSYKKGAAAHRKKVQRQNARRESVDTIGVLRRNSDRICSDELHASDGERALSSANDEPLTAHKRAARDFDEYGDEIVQDENEFYAQHIITENASETAAVVVKLDVQQATATGVHKRIVRAGDSDEDDEIFQNGNDGQDATVVELGETYNVKRRKMIFDDDD
jgi:hypothetical protein